MFSTFFYTCKAKGLNITLKEWLTLQEALDKGLCGSSLTQFYYLARMILVKSETEFDKFDLAFEETFKNIQSENEISKNMMKWLDKSELIDMVDEEERYRMNEQDGMQFIDKDEVEAKFKERLRDQDSEHNGGSFWIGSMGGFMGGIRVGGTTGYQSAFQVIGARKYRDFRDDKMLDNRQFQLAFRKLRQFSTKLDIPKTELDIDGTIDKTCNNGGYLQIVMDKPRKNYE